MRESFSRSSSRYTWNVSERIFRDLKFWGEFAAGLSNCPHDCGPDGVTYHRLGSTGERPVGWQKWLPWHERLSGELSALRTVLKRVGAFALKPCIAANLIKRILHRSGRTSSSSQFRRPTSLLWLLTNRRRGLSTEPRELVTLNAIDADKGLDQRMAPSPPCHRCYTRCVSCVSTPTHITW